MLVLGVGAAGAAETVAAAPAATAAPAAAVPDAAPAAAVPPTLAAKVIKVNDGDSLEVQTDTGTMRVRLFAVDTPEYDQPYGEQSSAFIKTLIPIGSAVEIEVISQDQFRRAVAIVWIASGAERINVNEKLLREGHAWAYRRYMKDPRYCDLEAEARDHKLGLWSRPVKDWVYPPEWRSVKNGEIRALPTPYEETKARCLEVLGLAGSHTYVPPNSPPPN
jgi:micrococcal nuclease